MEESNKRKRTYRDSFSNSYDDIFSYLSDVRNIKESKEKIKETCYGCINHRPGQRDHMAEGGCLYYSDSE